MNPAYLLNLLILTDLSLIWIWGQNIDRFPDCRLSITSRQDTSMANSIKFPNLYTNVFVIFLSFPLPASLIYRRLGTGMS